MCRRGERRSSLTHSRRIGALVLVLLVLAAAVALGNAQRAECPQPEVQRAPEIPLDPARAASRLARAVRFRTISPQEPRDFDPRPFLAFHEFLRTNYPTAHRVLTREVVNRYSLLYTWKGADPARKPVLVLAHMDVVPVEPGTERQWIQPPFSGRVVDGHVWGRGSMDDKVAVLAALEAVEHLAARGFAPDRTVYFAFGHDEELGGAEGAAKIAELLRARGVRADYVIDEGLTIVRNLIPGVTPPVAMVGIVEKGRVSLELTASGAPGHASMPPPNTAIGILAAAIQKLEANPMRPTVIGPVRELFACVAPQMAFARRLVVRNLWLFEPLLTRELARSPTTNAGIRTTMAATIIGAGTKSNVLPSEATAILDFRILPGDDSNQVIEHVRRVISDPRVSVRPLDRTEPSPVSPTDSASYRRLAGTIKQVFPDAVVAPGLMIAGSDSRHYVSLSDAVYRFLPLRVTPEELRGIHGINERIAVDNYADIIRFYIQLIRNTAS
ncbi:MAG TPA: M20 family peptidase [Methylomirabilota bacterium]|nr:M20 family peptidase [Methylomirabilota bacterium]